LQPLASRASQIAANRHEQSRIPRELSPRSEVQYEFIFIEAS